VGQIYPILPSNGSRNSQAAKNQPQAGLFSMQAVCRPLLAEKHPLAGIAGPLMEF